MKHTARKIRAGLYQYRGFTIERVEGVWHITWPGEQHAHDAANTLADAKDSADLWRDSYGELDK